MARSWEIANHPYLSNVFWFHKILDMEINKTTLKIFQYDDWKRCTNLWNIKYFCHFIKRTILDSLKYASCLSEKIRIVNKWNYVKIVKTIRVSSKMLLPRVVKFLPRILNSHPNQILVQVTRQSSDKVHSRYRFDQAKSRRTLQPVNFLLLVRSPFLQLKIICYLFKSQSPSCDVMWSSITYFITKCSYKAFSWQSMTFVMLCKKKKWKEGDRYSHLWTTPCKTNTSLSTTANICFHFFRYFRLRRLVWVFGRRQDETGNLTWLNNLKRKPRFRQSLSLKSKILTYLNLVCLVYLSSLNPFRNYN